MLVGIGENTHKQLNIDVNDETRSYTTLKRVEVAEDIAWVGGGTCFSLLLNTKGSVYEWGQIHGQYTQGLRLVQFPLQRVIKMASCGRKHSICLAEGGFVFTWGTGYFGQLVRI